MPDTSRAFVERTARLEETARGVRVPGFSWLVGIMVRKASPVERSEVRGVQMGEYGFW
jgi:hypothetical protein